MRAPVQRDIVIYQGADYLMRLRVKAGGTVVDTDDYAARFTVRQTDWDGAVMIAATDTNGQIVLGINEDDDVNLDLHLTAAQTAALEDWGRGVWDLELEDDFGHVTRLMEGAAYLSREASYDDE